VLRADDQDRLTDEPDVAAGIDRRRVERLGTLTSKAGPRHFREDSIPRQARIETRIEGDVGAQQPDPLTVFGEGHVVDARVGPEPHVLADPAVGPSPHPPTRIGLVEERVAASGDANAGSHA
jgi:hypothetical protein